MANTEKYIKYALYAVGAYLAYEKLWPVLSSEATNLSNKIANFGNSNVATITNPSGTPSSTVVNTGAISTAQGLAAYYITAQDKANIALLAPVGTLSLNFSQWAIYYQQAKGMTLPFTANDVNISDSTDLINIDQFTLLVNAKVPAPSLAGFIQGYYGVEQQNSWYGVMD